MSAHNSDTVAVTVLSVVSYVTASLILVVGIVTLSGFLLPEYVPSNIRIILGIIMTGYGVYRIAMLRIKQKHARRYEE